MRRELSDALIGLYTKALGAGVLDRPRTRRAFEAAYLGYKGLLEAGPITGLSTCVPRGSTVIDVGANIGFFTVRFARWVGPDGRVIAVEPELRNVQSLRRRVEGSGMSDRVDCIHAAAADRPGTLRLAITPGHPGDHHLADVGVPVRAVSLDELTRGSVRPVSLVKIDVQGAETLVLEGARRLIEEQRPAMFVEVDGPSLSRSGSSPRQLLELVIGYGYRPHRLIREGAGAVEEISDLEARARFGYIDVLFMPDDGQAR